MVKQHPGVKGLIDGQLQIAHKDPFDGLGEGTFLLLLECFLHGEQAVDHIDEVFLIVQKIGQESEVQKDIECEVTQGEEQSKYVRYPECKDRNTLGG